MSMSLSLNMQLKIENNMLKQTNNKFMNKAYLSTVNPHVLLRHIGQLFLVQDRSTGCVLLLRIQC